VALCPPKAKELIKLYRINYPIKSRKFSLLIAVKEEFGYHADKLI